jgi:glc operon protein GlcG
MKPYLRMTIVLAVLSLVFASRDARAQQWPNPYGPPIGVEAARKAVAAANAEGKKNGWTVAVAVVDTAGDLVYFERMDGTQAGSVKVSQEKARTAARFKRPSKAFEDAIANGRNAILGLPDVTPIEGGIPIVLEGKIVGAIGVSGGTSPQDAQCASAGASALGKQPTAPPPAAPPATPPPPKK